MLIPPHSEIFLNICFIYSFYILHFRIYTLYDCVIFIGFYQFVEINWIELNWIPAQYQVLREILHLRNVWLFGYLRMRPSISTSSISQGIGLGLGS